MDKKVSDLRGIYNPAHDPKLAELVSVFSRCGTVFGEPNPTRWQSIKFAVLNWRDRCRMRVALWIAPWLEGGE